MSKVEIKNVDKYYGKNHVLKNLNLTINDGAFMTLLGPSGCGKTTTLRVIAGLEQAQSGVILFDGQEVVNAKENFSLPSSKRNLNLVFQSYALWPHMTVFENVAFGLNLKKLPKEEVEKKVSRSLERMQISQFKDRYPSELSGGQQQRVAIARAIVSEPKLLLMDEPLSNLDAKLRMDMRLELKRLHRDIGTTVIYVTHDQLEALTMSTDIAIFFDGVLEQVGSPIDVYTNPATLRVADFIGNPRTNFVNGKYTSTKEGLSVETEIGSFKFKSSDVIKELIKKDGTSCVVGIRPEQINVSKNSTGKNDVEAVITSVMPSGSETLVEVDAGKTRLLLKQIGLKHFSNGEKIYLSFTENLFTVYDKKSGKLIKKAVDENFI